MFQSIGYVIETGLLTCEHLSIIQILRLVLCTYKYTSLPVEQDWSSRLSQLWRGSGWLFSPSSCAHPFQHWSKATSPHYNSSSRRWKFYTYPLITMRPRNFYFITPCKMEARGLLRWPGKRARVSTPFKKCFYGVRCVPACRSLQGRESGQDMSCGTSD